jgi:hypothetical protein
MGDISYLFASQILAYDVVTGQSSVFAEPAAGSKGFTSMLGLEFTPECGIAASHQACFLYASDFAGQILKYTIGGDLELSLETDYPAPGGGNSIGAISIGRGNLLYSVGFKSITGPPAGVPGAILRYKYENAPGEEPFPRLDRSAALFAGGTDGEAKLVRPIGILALPRPTTPSFLQRLLGLFFWFCG